MPDHASKFGAWLDGRLLWLRDYISARTKRHEFGFTADMDNVNFSPSGLEHFRRLFRETLVWLPPSPRQKRRFLAEPQVRQSADALVAVSGADQQEYWVLENFSSGFPDPAEFLFVGFRADKSIFARGRFEDWPNNWQRITA